MFRPTVLTLAFLSCLLLIARPAAAQSASLAGLVLSTTGRPVAGATLVLQPSAGAAVETVSDDAGRFVFGPLAPGEYALTARAVGFSAVTRRLTLAPAATAEALTLQLPEVFRERVHVVGDSALVERAPGAAHVIDAREMARLTVATSDIHQMLRQVPGLNIQEEDGYGLRPNIGMRGSGSDRSSKVALMEDGVLIAPAPYAAPAAYYAPTAARMESLEVRKGSSQLKHGPMTTGGALNFISTSIPATLRLTGTMSGGGDGTRRIAANVGNAHRNGGWLVETFQFRNRGFKELDGGGDTGVEISDHLLKLRLNTTPTLARYQEVEIKLGRTVQMGDETYLGLTDDDFGATPLRRYAASQRDRLTATHEQYQVRHLLARRGWDLTTLGYRNDFQRAWYKLDSVEGAGLSAILANSGAQAARLALLRGADSAPDALTVRDNNRTYYSAGVQSVLGISGRTGGVGHQFEAGVRLHQDEEDRFQRDDRYQMLGGRMILTRPGAPGSQSNQVGQARAAAGFVTDTLTWGRWSATPGLRYEHIRFDQTVYARTDPDRAAPVTVASSTVTALIPGAGVSFAAPGALTIFGGVHKGFAPPGPGAQAGTSVEHSVNYELGARIRRGDFQGEATAYLHAYGNLLGRDSLATGGSGDGQLFNGGRARASGLEVSGAYEAGRRLGLGVRLPLRVAYSLTRAEFRHAFQSQFGPWGSVQIGDELPYVPRHQGYLSGDIEGVGWRGRLEATWVGRMRTRAGQGAFLAEASTDASLILTLSGEYEITAGARLFASVHNAANSLHVVARHPAGVRPGLPRLVQVGLRVGLGE